MILLYVPCRFVNINGRQNRNVFKCFYERLTLQMCVKRSQSQRLPFAENLKRTKNNCV